MVSDSGEQGLHMIREWLTILQQWFMVILASGSHLSVTFGFPSGEGSPNFHSAGEVQFIQIYRIHTMDSCQIQ